MTKTSENKIFKENDILEKNPFDFHLRKLQPEKLNILFGIIQLLEAELGPALRPHNLLIGVHNYDFLIIFFLY